MRLTRIFVAAELETGRSIDLPAQAGAHVAKVLRARSGDELILFNGDGREFIGIVESARGRLVTAAVGASRSVETESRIAITLVQCLPRGEKMDLVVQKATELGVTRIVPVMSERSVVRLDQRQADSKQIHWRAIAIAACEQCGRAKVPVIDSPIPLLSYLGQSHSAAHVRWVLTPQTVVHEVIADTLSRRLPMDKTDVAIGPEGGFAESEINAFKLAGFLRLQLGPRILRTETAAIAAMVHLQTLFGDMS